MLSSKEGTDIFCVTFKLLGDSFRDPLIDGRGEFIIFAIVN